MNYTALSFWALFLGVYLVYWRLGHKSQNTWLLLSSYVFYASWDPQFLFLIVLSTAIDLLGGLGVAGVTVERALGRRVAGVVVGASIVFGSNLPWHQWWTVILDGHTALSFAPLQLTNFRVPIATVAAVLLYWQCAKGLYRWPSQQRRKAFLIFSVGANLAILGYFKYADFFVTSFLDLARVCGVHLNFTTLNVILPLGISFYTFQAMSYTVDVYRGHVEPTRSFRDFALFVCFFPHLIAGPIMRAHTLLPQITRPRADPRRTARMTEGGVLVLVGLFKKLVIADNMAPLANAVFQRREADAPELGGAVIMLGVYAFALQIYGDFSGYSAIARGISKWLGFELSVNFHLPYLATTPGEFWRRWHISLSSWLRDYVYIPLGGNRVGRAKEYRNLFLTMLLGGLWHGASWHFVAWGAFHGLLLAIFRLARVPTVERTRHPGRWVLRVVLVFHLTCLGWLLFRADSLETAWQMLVTVFAHFDLGAPLVRPFATLIVVFGLLPCLLELPLQGEARLNRLWRSNWWVQAAAYLYLGLMILFYHARQSGEFIYFQF